MILSHNLGKSALFGAALARLGVVRCAMGNAEVHLASPGYDVTLHPDQVENVLIFRGSDGGFCD